MFVFNMDSNLSVEELRSFHAMDREIYSRLVINLRRNLAQSMQVMALWIWLERTGFPNIIMKMLLLANALVNALADESVNVLNCLEMEDFQPSVGKNDIPLMQGLMRREISLIFFHENRIAVINGVTKLVNDSLTKAFEDIMQQALTIITCQPVVPPQGRIRATRERSNVRRRQVGEGSSSTVHERPMAMRPTASLVRPMVLPGVSRPSLGAGARASPSMVVVPGPNVRPGSTDFQSGEGSSGNTSLNPKAPSWNPGDEVPQDDRTMFITFSKGYPMSEGEVREFFTRNYGDCIEYIYMQEVPPNTQSLFARLVFRIASTIGTILNGKEKAKFVINGKHVWARVYVPKRNKSP